RGPVEPGPAARLCRARADRQGRGAAARLLARGAAAGERRAGHVPRHRRRVLAPPAVALAPRGRHAARHEPRRPPAARAPRAAAATPMVVPGGQQIARLDPAKLAERLAAVPADDPNRAEIEKEVERRQTGLDRVFNATAAQVVQRLETAGTDASTGSFSLSRG